MNGLNNEDVIEILRSLKNDRGIARRFDVRVRQVAERNKKVVTEEQVFKVVRRLMREWGEAIDQKIAELG